MKQWLAVAIAWIVSLFAFWKLGEHNETQNAKIKTLENKQDSVVRGNNAGERASANWVRKNKQR